MRDIGSESVGWVMFEILLAIAVAVVIVWWTIPKKPKPPADSSPPGDGDR